MCEIENCKNCEYYRFTRSPWCKCTGDEIVPELGTKNSYCKMKILCEYCDENSKNEGS